MTVRRSTSRGLALALARARYERRTRRRLRTPENPGRCSKRRSGTIARGEHTPAKGEPKVWFTSIESFAKLLSEHNRHRLELIAWERPGSLTELAELAGRSKSNLSRTLKTMSQCGPAEVAAGERGSLVPRAPYDQVRLDVSLTGTRSGSVGASS